MRFTTIKYIKHFGNKREKLMAKPTAKIQITIETLQRTVIRKRQVHSMDKIGVFELPRINDDIASASLPPKAEKRTAAEDPTILDNEMEK